MKEALAVRENLLDDGIGKIELMDSMGNDLYVVNFARISFLGETKGDEKDRKLLRYLLRNRHTTPFESVEFIFRVKCPLFIRSQWHRHRHWSYNEVSRRYTEENIEFYTPSIWRTQSTNNKQGSSSTVALTINGHINYDYQNELKHVVQLYNLWVHEYGVAKEQARMVLPQSLYTTFYAKVDLWNLLHFINLRSDEHAQWEIRQYSDAMLEMIRPIVPWTVEAFEDYIFGK